VNGGPADCQVREIMSLLATTFNELFHTPKLCHVLLRISASLTSKREKGKGTKICIMSHTCLYLVSVHQTAPPLASGISHLITVFTHLSTP